MALAYASRRVSPIRRSPRSGDHRATEVSAGENYTCQSAPHLGSLVLIHQFKKRRRICQSRVSLWPSLKNMPVKALLVPGIKGLPAEVWGNFHTPADYLAAFHGYINLTTAWITGYRMEPSL